MRIASSTERKGIPRRELSRRAARLLGPQSVQKLIAEEFPCQDSHGMLGCTERIHGVRCAASRRHRAQRLVERVLDLYQNQ
jgi:hypothetical protein